MGVTTYAEEVTRKTLDTCESLALRHEHGVLNDREFQIAINAVWDCVSGLVDAMDPIMKEVVAMSLTPEPSQIVMSNKTAVFIIQRKKALTAVTDALTHNEHQLKVHFDEIEAAQHVAKLVRAFETKGFKRL